MATTRSNLRSIRRGFQSIRLDPSSDLRRLEKEIASRDIAAEAWTQTGRALRQSMGQFKTSSSK